MDYKVEHVEGITELLRLRRDPLAYMQSLSSNQVDVRHIRVGKREIFMVNQPELIQNVLVTHDWNFIKGRGLRSSKPMLGDGLLTSEGELHRRQRRMVQPAFHSNRMEGYAAAMVQASAAMCDRWKDRTQCDVHAEMMKLTLGIVGSTMFGAEVRDDAPEIGKNLTEALHIFMRLNSLPAQFVAPIRRRYEKQAKEARQGILEVLRPMLDAHRASPEAYEDMLSMLMAAHDEPGTGYMSEELLLDECLTLFLAGHETTANALTWSLLLLSGHPAEEATVREELDALLAHRLPTMDDLARLPRTTAFFREALRLYPPAWIVTREAVTPYVLGDVQVPAGGTVVMSPYTTQRDARFWSSPDTFDPSRWLVPAERPRFSYFPFGAGTRVCIGEHFAMMEGVLVLATLLRSFQVCVLEPEKVEAWPQLTLRPRGAVSARLTPRAARKTAAREEFASVAAL